MFGNSVENYFVFRVIVNVFLIFFFGKDFEQYRNEFTLLGIKYSLEKHIKDNFTLYKKPLCGVRFPVTTERKTFSSMNLHHQLCGLISLKLS